MPFFHGTERKVNRKSLYTDKNGFLTKIGFRKGTKQKGREFRFIWDEWRNFLAQMRFGLRVVYFAVSQNVWPHLGRIWITIRAVPLSGDQLLWSCFGALEFPCSDAIWLLEIKLVRGCSFAGSFSELFSFSIGKKFQESWPCLVDLNTLRIVEKTLCWTKLLI